MINERLGIIELELHQMRAILLLLRKKRLAPDEPARLIKLDHKTKPRLKGESSSVMS